MEWISVKDRLPEVEEEVLACYYFKPFLNKMFVGVLTYFVFDEEPHWQYESIGLTVTHWMDLPELPKEEEENE